MTSERELINRVAQSPLITIDLEELYEPGERVAYDLKDNLYDGIILKEKDFREHIRMNDWSAYSAKHVAVHCSVDAIVPRWAYMLLAAHLEPFAKTMVYGDLHDLENELFRQAILKLDPSEYADKKVVIKGCSKIEVPISAYLEITRHLRPYAFSIMYGEPCSTVPVYKRPTKSK